MATAPITIEMALRWGCAELAAVSDSPQLDASVLLRHAGDYSPADLIARSADVVPQAAASRFRHLVQKRHAGRPIAQLTGRREFWSLELQVSAEVLLPRPETELLVEKALALIPPGSIWQLADLGTGSGAIALALARERPLCKVVATDLSAAALEIAGANCTALGVKNVELLQGSWFQPLSGRRFQLVISNPPYVAADDACLQQGDVRFEPRGALTAGEEGLEALRRIIQGAGEVLLPGGWLLLEHGWQQRKQVLGLLEQAGFQDLVEMDDLAGRPRVAGGRYPQSTRRRK